MTLSAQKPRVVVVGAGPGGAAAAIRLAERGVGEVTLVDKDRFPRDKTCGSALSPNALKVLDALGVREEVVRRGYLIHALRLITPGRRQLHIAGDQAAVILLRREFDDLLVQRARGLGVVFRDGFRVRGLVRREGRVVGVEGPDGRLEADQVLCADGAHALFSGDPRPKQIIQTIMGWWEGFPIEPGTLEMVYDRRLLPLYGWMFPETAERVNIGICIDDRTLRGRGPRRGAHNIREVFEAFLRDHYGDRLRQARPVGRWQGHPISHTTWIDHCFTPGALQLGECARLTHNATGEGIFQAMQSGLFAADTIADVLGGAVPEPVAHRRYRAQLRRRFTTGILVGHVFRGLVRTPILDGIARLSENPRVRRLATRLVGSALAGTQVSESKAGATITRAPAPAKSSPSPPA